MMKLWFVLWCNSAVAAESKSNSEVNQLSEDELLQQFHRKEEHP